MAMNSRPSKPLGMQRTLRGNAPAQGVNPVTSTPKRVAPRTSQKETVVIKNLSDLSSYTPDGKKKEKRFSAIITGMDADGNYILKNAYTKIVWKEGKEGDCGSVDPTYCRSSERIRKCQHWHECDIPGY